MILADGINWVHAWPYVGTGYVLATVVIGGYAAWVLRKLRRAERSFDTADAVQAAPAAHDESRTR